MSAGCTHHGRACPANCNCSCSCEDCTVAIVKEHIVKPAVQDFQKAEKTARKNTKKK